VSRRFGRQEVLKGVNLALPKKGLIAIVGESGSGKSTLLNILSGLDIAYQGKASVLGKEFKKMSEAERMEFRLRSMGYLFQSFNLLELETVLTNVIFPLNAISLEEKNTKKRRAIDLISYVGLKKKRDSNVATLSGGEKQRVALARALINDPKILLCDEPTGALDEENGKAVFSLLQKVAQNRLVIVVSHDRKLVSEHAERILLLRKGRIVTDENQAEAEEEGEVLAAKAKQTKKRSALPSGFLLSHASHLLSSKKKRSILSLSMIATGLLGLGLSLYVSESIETEIAGAFDSFLSREQIVMSARQNEGAALSNVFSAPLEDVLPIKEEFPDDVSDIGTTYFGAYETIFKDANYLYTTRGHNQIILSSFSIRTAADYLWLDEYQDAVCYPHFPRAMEDDSIVLGLPYSDMFNLCFDLKIVRTYESLGNYITSFGLPVVFSLANYAWGYEDEQIFNVVAIMATSQPTIFHLSHDWSTFLFEESMRFPATDSQEIPEDKPWTLRKVHYLAAKKDMTTLLKGIREKEGYESFVFQRATSDYNLSVCRIGDFCGLNRAYVYEADKSGIPYREIKKAAGEGEYIGSYSILTNGSFVAYGGSLFVGFAQKFFLSKDEEALNQVIDAYSDVRAEEADLDFDLPEGVYDGNYLKSTLGGLHFSSDFSRLKEGRAPTSVEEICLSSSLKDRYGDCPEVKIAGEVSSETVGNYLRRSFRVSTLKVVGIVESEKPTIYGVSDWAIDFFRDQLGMSAFYLEPTGAILNAKDPDRVKEAVDFLSAKYPNYVFSSPSQEILSSISETMSYISGILFAFSWIALIVSGLLYGIVLIVSIMENEREGWLLYLLGIARKDIYKSYLAQAFLYSFLPYLIAALPLLGLEFGVHGYIASSFGGSTAFLFSWSPFVAMFCFCLGFFLLAALILASYAWKKRFWG
ncbi:MAG: ABC transporter ATP-binding protein/permease, partial [Bacilli bacterium]|nr:ABC transporter ATP-binding protein/permease [Bacilli bacterium]